MGPRAGLHRCGKSRPPPGFDPRTVQPVASRYTDYGTRPTHSRRGGVKGLGHSVDHPTPTSAEVKEGIELHICSPSEHSWPVLQ